MFLVVLAMLSQAPQPRAFLQKNLRRQGTASAPLTCAVTPCPPALSSLKVWLDATNVDGASNGTLSNLDAIATWTNLAPSGTNFTQSDTDIRPHLKKLTTVERSVSFDGITDELTATGTKSTLKFVHETGVFDLVVVLRRKGTCIQNEKRVIGSAEGEKGLFVAWNCPNNTTGSWWVILGNGSAFVSSSRYPTKLTPLGEPSKVLIRGTGTDMKVSTDFSTFTTVAFTGEPFGTGDSLYDWSVAACSSAEDIYNTADADLFQVLLYNKNLSNDELTELQTMLDSRVGSGI